MVKLWVDIASGADLTAEYGWEPLKEDGSGKYLNLDETFTKVRPERYDERMDYWEQNWDLKDDNGNGGGGGAGERRASFLIVSLMLAFIKASSFC